MPFSAAEPTFVTAKLLSAAGDAIQNVFAIKRAGGSVDESDVREAIIEWLEAIYTELLGIISEEVDFSSVNIFHSAGDEATGDWPWDTLTSGSATGDQLPPGDAALINFYTGVSKRIGKKFIGALTEAAQDNGVLNASAITALTAAGLVASQAYTAGNGVSFVPVIYDRVNDVMRNILEYTTPAIIAYQRRRRQGRGV